MLQKSILALTLMASALTAGASEADSTTVKVRYIPQIHGVVRGRFEASTEDGDYRFEVRNARLTVGGNIAPFADYFIQTDFCDQGKIKILDAWARAWFSKSFGVQAGQFRMPFGVDPFRAPSNYIFANRSFMGKQMCNYRAVGAKFMWHPVALPMTIEAGAFNPGTIGDHTPWHNTLTYAAKLTADWDNVTFTTGFQSIRPDGVRANLVDAAATWKYDRWIVAGEYMYEHYTRNRHRDAHSYLVYADYSMPIHAGFFNNLSFQGRFDGITAHSSAVRDSDGEITTTTPAHNRLTVGSTISYLRSKTIGLDFRLNYEKYFYHHGVDPTAENGDKIVAEMVIRF